MKKLLKWVFFVFFTISCSLTASGSYVNPVLESNFPDPTVIKGDDGYFYAYSTQGKLGDIPIYRSPDLVNWEYAAVAFPDSNKRPRFLPGGNLWAPDIIKNGEKYILIYSQSKWGEEHKNGLGLAESDNPAGPFFDNGKLFTSDEIGVQNSIDPSFFKDDDGRIYLLWGSFSGLYMLEFDMETLKPLEDSPLIRVAGSAFEGSHIYKHKGKYYLFVSTGTCCEGERSTYKVGVGRSDSPAGPYLDKEGNQMLDNNYTLVITGNEICKGPGHGSQIITDDEGQTWYLFHGYLRGRSNEGRMMWLEQLLWDEEGWPYVESGTPSFTPQSAPVFNKNP